MHLYANVTRADFRKSNRGSAGSCVLATALTRQYGGEWFVAGRGAIWTDGRGTQKSYRLSAGAMAKMIGFDFGIPGTSTGRVRLTGGRSVRSIALRRKAAAGVVCGAFAVAALGFAWVFFAIAGAIAAVIAVVAAVKFRSRPAAAPAVPLAKTAPSAKVVPAPSRWPDVPGWQDRHPVPLAQPKALAERTVLSRSTP
ncbi:MAG: hypothetical protein J2P30_00030 [Actinobacteria bacterium]|nr:hypothetical protein [Actinomycetota bacterium]